MGPPLIDRDIPESGELHFTTHHMQYEGHAPRGSPFGGFLYIRQHNCGILQKSHTYGLRRKDLTQIWGNEPNKVIYSMIGVSKYTTRSRF